MRAHYRGHQFFDEVGAPIGYIPREQSVNSLGHEYNPLGFTVASFSLTDPVYSWNGRHIIIRLTGRNEYQAFEVPADVHIYSREKDAIRKYAKGVGLTTGTSSLLTS